MFGILLLAATFANPVLPADFSDLDCIRHEGRYYAITSTLHLSPGMDVLASDDMVDWQITGHVVDDTSVFGDDWTWKRMRRYGRDVWAGCIRERNGMFYCYFGTPDEGLFVATAEKAEGPWSAPHKMAHFGKGWDDTGVLFDGTNGYLVATHFADKYKTYAFRLTADGREVVPETKTLINEGKGREANKFYTWNGLYYHLYSEAGRSGRRLMMARARSPFGPYAERRVLSHPQPEADEPNQGGFLEDDAGNWFFFTHHGHGQWYGRAASLLPVTWIDGWPVVGTPDKDGIGTMVWEVERPKVTAPPRESPRPESTRSESTRREVTPGTFLSPDWAWNHAPRRDTFTLIDEQLILRPFRPLNTNDFLTVGNVYTQRAFRPSSSSVFSVALDASHLAEGSRAGICHLGGDTCEFGLAVEDGHRVLYVRRNKRERVVLASDMPSRVVLRTAWNAKGVARFASSSDGKSFIDAGIDFTLRWGNYRGDRVGVYAYALGMAAGESDAVFLLKISRQELSPSVERLSGLRWFPEMEDAVLRVPHAQRCACRASRPTRLRVGIRQPKAACERCTRSTVSKRPNIFSVSVAFRWPRLRGRGRPRSKGDGATA